jgi:YbbR domain-containing protein
MKDLSADQQRWRRHTYKLISLLFSIFLWFYVLNSEPLEIERKVNLNFVVPKGLAISNLPAREVVVKLKGSRAFVKNLFQKNEKIFIDLKRYPYLAKTGLNVNLTSGDVPVPFGVEVVSVIPNKFNIRLEKKIRKEVPIVSNFVGELSDELKLIGASVKPGKIFISGPISTMRTVGKLKTTPVDLGNLSGKGEMRVTLADIDPRIDVKETQALLKYEIRPKKANLTLKKIPIQFVSTTNRFSSKVKQVSIDVLATEGASIKEGDVRVMATVPKKGRGKYTVRLEASLPDGVHLLKIHPEVIEVRIR